MWKEFREFIMQGNVLDLAVGIIIGGAFGQVVNSFVNDVLMPPIGLLLGRVDFSNLYINLSGREYESLQAAREAGAATLNYGLFINTVINFLIVGLAVFLVVKTFNQARRVLARRAEEALPAPTTKLCPYCFTDIPVEATRCPNCTSHLESQRSSAG